MDEVMAAVDPAPAGEGDAAEAAAAAGGCGGDGGGGIVDDLESGRGGIDGRIRGKAESGSGPDAGGASKPRGDPAARAARARASSSGCKEGELGEGEHDAREDSYHSSSSHFDEKKMEEGMAPSY